METLIYSFNAVTPLLLLISLGYILKRIGKWDRSFFSLLNNFCYRVLLPIQLFYNVYKIEKLVSVNWKALIYTISWIPISIGIGAILAKSLIKENSQKGAFVQSTFRSNQAIMGLPLAESLGGTEATAIASLATSAGIPLFNISAVIILKAYAKDSKDKSKIMHILKAVITNPLIIGVVAGLLCVGIRYLITTADGTTLFSIQNNLPPIWTAIKTLSAIASPVMLICLGASLDFSFAKSLFSKICIGVIMRLVVIPTLAIGIALLFRDYLSITKIEMPMMIAFFGSPTAVSSAILVKEMGGDEQYATQLVIWSSVFSMITLFSIVAILRSMNFL